MTQHPMGFLRTLGQMVSRNGLASIFSNRFEGARQYYKIFGYQDNLQYEHLLSKYTRQGVASRIVEAPSQALWDNPPVITSNDEDWNNAWNRLVVKNNLWQALLKVDNLCGIGRYSCLYIGVQGRQKPNAPANGELASGLRNVLYLQPYSQVSAEIDSLSNNQNSPQYLLPYTYTVYPFRQNQGDIAVKTPETVSSFKVHHSRMLHVAENTLEDTVYGLPRMERVFNDLDDLLKVSGGTAETFWLTANRGMQVDIDKEMELSPEDAADLSEELDEFQNQLRRYVRTRGVKIESIGSDIPKPKETFEMLISLISGATGIPKRILIGAEAGQLASEQDRANWADRVEMRRKDFGEPVVLFPLISILTNLGVLPKRDDIEIVVNWPDAYKLSPLEIAQKSAQHARSATNFAKAIDTMTNLKKGTPGTEPQLDEDGNPIPGTGTDAEPGIEMDDLISIEEARTMMELENPVPQINDTGDLQETN